MYRFKTELNLDFRNRKKASEYIGINFGTLGQILRGDITCSKSVARSITQLFYKNAEIEDFFVNLKEKRCSCE